MHAYPFKILVLPYRIYSEEEAAAAAGGGPSESESEESGSTIHVATTLAGPWRPLSPNTLGGAHSVQSA